MSKLRRTERLALYVCLPLLAVVCYATWQLWTHVQVLDESLADSRQTEIDLLTQARDAKGREALAGEALLQSLSERDSARSEADRLREDAQSAQEEAERQGRIAEKLRQQRMNELDRMRDALGRIAETDRTPMGMVVQLSEDSFLFDFDSAELRPENREILSRIAGVLLASYGYSVYVYGHTDDQGDPAYNQDLSERRARSVKAYLAAAGIPGDNIDSKGFGQSSPRAQGMSREARRRNRRVEVGIVDTIIEYKDTVAGGGGRPAPQP